MTSTEHVSTISLEDGMSTDTSSTSWGSQVRVLYRPWGPLAAEKVVRGLSNAKYHADPDTVSKSGFWLFHTEGPAAFHSHYVVRDAAKTESSALSHGTLLHDWLEQGSEEFWAGVAIAPSSTVTPTGLLGKQSREWARENAPDKKLISPNEADQLEKEIARLEGDPKFLELMDERQESEVSCFFNLDDFPCRTRPDLICGGKVVDLKTTRETGLYRNFWKAVVRYGYHAQDYLYQQGMRLLGLDPKPLVFVVVSTAPAHETLICTLPPALTALGGEIIHTAIADIRLRIDLDCWLPDQHGEVVELPVPAHCLGGE